MKDIVGFLQGKQQAAIDEQVGAEWAKLEEFYTKKLWHQLTQKLLEFVHHPVFSEGDELIMLYKSFISDFEHRINPLSLMELAFVIAKQFDSQEECIKYLETIREKVKSSQEAVVLCLTACGLRHLKDEALDKCKIVIEEAGDILDQIDGVSSIHGRYYQLSATYHKHLGNHADFYQNTLRYLGCIDLSTLTDEQKSDQAVALSLAALLGKGVYNFGELLSHSILDSIKGSDNQWLIDVLFAFNSGDIHKWQQMKPQWSQVPDLVSHENELRQKMMLLCLMEMTFRRAAKSRQLTFTQIAECTGLPLCEVELLVMRALSLGLVKGRIDEVEQKVHMTWVQPRVLDKQQIGVMQDRLSEWSSNVKEMEILLETNAHEILDKMYH